MKCHLCQKELQLEYENPDSSFKKPPYATWECPDVHARIAYRKSTGEMVNYTLYWDGDAEAQERYKLESNHDFGGHKTVLYKITTDTLPNRKYYKYPSYTKVLSIQDFFELPIKDDSIQADNLIPRLLRLKAFS